MLAAPSLILGATHPSCTDGERPSPSTRSWRARRRADRPASQRRHLEYLRHHDRPGPRPDRARSRQRDDQGTGEGAGRRRPGTGKSPGGRARPATACATRSTALDAGRRAGRIDGRGHPLVGEELRAQGKDQPAEARRAGRAARRVLGDYLKRSDGDTILRDVEDFGRRQPWAVIAGGVVLGFAASRFLKASSSRRYHEQGARANLPRARRRRRPPTTSRPPRRAPPRRPPTGRARARASPTGGVLPRQQTGPGASQARRTAHVDPRRTDARERGHRRAGQGARRARPRRWSGRRSSWPRPRSRRRASWPARARACWPARRSPRCSASVALTALLIVALDSALALWLAALIVTVCGSPSPRCSAMAGKKALQQRHTPCIRRPLKP